MYPFMYMALIITPKYQYFRRTSRKEAVQISLPEGRILGTLPVENFKDKGASEFRKPRVSTADSDLRVKKISRKSRVSTDSGISINSRVSREDSDSLSWQPEEQHESHPKGHLRKDSMVNANANGLVHSLGSVQTHCLQVDNPLSPDAD